MTERNKHFLNIIFRVFFTSLGTVAEIISLSLIFQKSISLKFLLFTVLIISIIYLTDFYREYSAQIYKAQKNIIRLLIAILIFYFAYITKSFNDIKIYGLSLLLLLLGLFYDPHFKRFTRIIVGFKDYFVILCFNLLVLSFLLLLGISPWAIVPILAFTITRDFINVTYCDIKDIASDDEKQYKTLAGHLGINRLIVLHIMISVLSMAIILIAVYLKVLPAICLMLIFSILITSALIFISHKKKRYSPTTVDLEYFSWLFFIYLGKLLL